MIDAQLLRKQLSLEPFTFEKSYITLQYLCIQKCQLQQKGWEMQILKQKVKDKKVKKIQSEVQIKKS